MKVITIGRSQDNDIVVNDVKVSRIHCQIIQHDNGSVGVTDCSTNGTFVNGQRITGETRLQANNTVQIGSTVLPWQSYFNPPQDTPAEPLPGITTAPKRKRTVWYIAAAIAVLLLVGGGITGKILYDKKQEKIAAEAAAKKKLEDEERARQEAAAEAAKKALEESEKAEAEARKAAELKLKEEKRLAEENQKKKDIADFDKLKTEGEKLKTGGANPVEKLVQMKKIADKYPADPYFKNAIKNLEK